MTTTFVVVERVRHTFGLTAGFLSPRTVRNRLSAVFPRGVPTLRVRSQRELIHRLRRTHGPSREL
jgi:hypothetical protein